MIASAYYGPIFSEIEGKMPGIDTTHRRAVFLLSLAGFHAIVPSLRHELKSCIQHRPHQQEYPNAAARLPGEHERHDHEADQGPRDCVPRMAMMVRPMAAINPHLIQRFCSCRCRKRRRGTVMISARPIS